MRQGHEAFEQHPGGGIIPGIVYVPPSERRGLCKVRCQSCIWREKSLEVASRPISRDMMADKGDVVRWLEVEGMTRLTGEASV